MMTVLIFYSHNGVEEELFFDNDFVSAFNLTLGSMIDIKRSKDAEMRGYKIIEIEYDIEYDDGLYNEIHLHPLLN
jgi:hypothetical protein